MTAEHKDKVRYRTCPFRNGSRCDGPPCMAWRWLRTHVPDDEGDLVPSCDTYGYCGAFGHPHAGMTLAD